MRYAFIQDNQHIWSVRRLCSTLDVHHSGYYAWLKQPTSKTDKKRQQLFGNFSSQVNEIHTRVAILNKFTVLS